MNRLFSALASIWSDSLDTSAIAELKQFGYYSTLVRPGLRVISLNTQYGANGNFWSLLNDTDPGMHASIAFYHCPNKLQSISINGMALYRWSVKMVG
jgi:hypothetical protein